jgi:hypothetical protein
LERAAFTWGNFTAGLGNLWQSANNIYNGDFNPVFVAGLAEVGPSFVAGLQELPSATARTLGVLGDSIANIATLNINPEFTAGFGVIADGRGWEVAQASAYQQAQGSETLIPLWGSGRNALAAYLNGDAEGILLNSVLLLGDYAAVREPCANVLRRARQTMSTFHADEVATMPLSVDALQAQLAQRAALADAAATPAASGIYEFPDAIAGGTPYVGQSGDIPVRLAQHEGVQSP